MAHKKSFLAIQTEFYSVAALVAFLRVVPASWGRSICRGLLRGLLGVLPKRHQLIRSQIAACFPEKTAAAVNDLAERSVENLADGIAACARIPGLSLETASQWATMEGEEHVEAAFKKGLGIVVFAGHFGAWELMAAYLTRRFPRVSMVVRPLDNPRLDALVSGVRSSAGGGVINSHRVLKDGLRHLRANGFLGILMDQNFYKGGIFVDFFGRPAATTTLVPLLARRTGSPVLPIRNSWRNGKIHIQCEAPVTLSTQSDPTVAIAEDTQMLCRIMEGWVREDPSQWLWLHNRWKRRPQPGDQVYSSTGGLITLEAPAVSVPA